MLKTYGVLHGGITRDKSMLITKLNGSAMVVMPLGT